MTKSITLSLSLAVALLLATATCSFAQVRVNGYTRSNGTYVQPYMHSNPDGNPNNNWSTRGNVNPYTGQEGTRNPTPTYSSPTNSYGRGTNTYGPRPSRLRGF